MAQEQFVMLYLKLGDLKQNSMNKTYIRYLISVSNQKENVPSKTMFNHPFLSVCSFYPVSMLVVSILLL